MTMTATNTTASNWAWTMLLLEETTQQYMTAVFNEHYSNRSNSITINNMTHLHNIGHIHCTLPIHGLPPESESGNQLTDNTTTQAPGLCQNYNLQLPSAQDKAKNSLTKWLYTRNSRGTSETAPAATGITTAAPNWSCKLLQKDEIPTCDMMDTRTNTKHHTPSPPVCKNVITTTNLKPKHDKGHTHCTLLIQGLPPEVPLITTNLNVTAKATILRETNGHHEGPRWSKDQTMGHQKFEGMPQKYQ